VRLISCTPLEMLHRPGCCTAWPFLWYLLQHPGGFFLDSSYNKRVNIFCLNLCDNFGFCVQIGRWLGYTTAVLFALISLFNIVQSFKRVLLFRAFMKKSQLEQEAMVDSLATKPSTATRMLARAMTGMRRVADVPAEALECSPFESTAAQLGLRQRHTTFKMQPTASFSPGTGALAPSGISSASNRSFSFAANTFKLPPTGSSAVSSSSTLKSFKESQHDSLCVNIAQDIQRLEVRLVKSACMHTARAVGESFAPTPNSALQHCIANPYLCAQPERVWFH